MLALQFGEMGPGLVRRVLRQLDIDAGVEPDIPAPRADPGDGADALLQIRLTGQQSKEIMRPGRGVGANHDRQVGKAARVLVRYFDAMGVDQGQDAVTLPERQRRTLLEPDEQGVRQAPFNRCGADPGQGIDTGFQRREIDPEDRRAAVGVDRRDQIAAFGPVAALDQNVGPPGQARS